MAPFFRHHYPSSSIADEFNDKCVGSSTSPANQIIPGVHIRSRPVDPRPDDYNLAWTTEVTLKVVPWTSEVLLNHKIFLKIPTLFYDVHFTCVCVLLIHLKC